MNDILFEVLKAIVIIAIMVVVRYMVPWIKAKTKLLNNELLESLITAAVQYAEQTITGANAGKEKKAIVTEFLREQLIARNISISDEQLDVLVESAVFAMNAAKSK